LAVSDLLPLVSVVVPTYNCERYVGEAIESIERQTYRHLEIIVVDDGSTDRTPEVVRRFTSSVRYVRQAHSGVGTARNRGAQEARGTVLAFGDADDRMLPHRLDRQVSAFLQDPSLEASYGRFTEFWSPDVGAVPNVRSPVSVAAAPMVNVLAIWKESFMRIGPFDPLPAGSTELEWRARAIDRGLRDVILDEVLQERRLHDANWSRRLRDDRLLTLKKVLAHRRRNPATTDRRDVSP
jgi:glycosyltransferase involved in cell wall biosynthesis